MSDTTVIVIGAGTMGRGIAQAAATCGCRVCLHDTDGEQLQRADDEIRRHLARAVEKGKLDRSDADAAAARLSTVDDFNALPFAETAFVIEAVVEQVEVKKAVLARAAGQVGGEAILASNTSTISITELAAATPHPERVIGMHFFNPVPLMRLVEVIEGLHTSPATVARVEALARQMGKTPLCVKDRPGFVSNRILLPMINEAIYCLMEGTASAETIDEIMKLGCNHPIGPLSLADLIGLDVCLNVLEVLHRDLGDPKFRPCPLLRTMVHAGRLGRKTGRGFFAYDAGEERR